MAIGSRLNVNGWDVVRGEFVAVYSAVKKHSVVAGLPVFGDLSIQGNIKPVRSLAEPLQVGGHTGP